MDTAELRRCLFSWPGADGGGRIPPDELSIAFEQYILYLELADRISERRQTANSFFLSVCTGAVALVGYVRIDKDPEGASFLYFLVSLAGLILCLIWHRIIKSYRD